MDKEKEEKTVDHMTEESQEDAEHEGATSVGGNEEQSKEKEKVYTQSQVDAMMAKARKKYTKGDINEEKISNVQQEQGGPERDLSTGITVEKLAQAELKAEMAINGMNPQKIARAVRLVDIQDVLDESGQYSDEKAKEAIEELLKEWPELKQASQQESNSFNFGAPEQEEQDSNQNSKSAISKIFGN